MPPDRVLEAYALSAGGYAFIFVLGTLFGSFANVCIYRWPPTDDHPKGRSVVVPGSHCFSCGTPVKWYDNVPLLSYLWLRGRCRACGVEFSARYLLVEAAMGLLFVAIWHSTMAVVYVDDPMSLRSLRFLIFAAFIFVCVVIAFIDLDHKLILDKMTYPAIPIFYGLGMLLPETRWWHGLVGAAVGYGVVRLIADGYYYLTGREGMGYGDGKLLAIVGALLGWQAVVFALFGGSLVGSVIGIGALVVSRGRADEDEDEPASEDESAPRLRLGSESEDASESAPRLRLGSESADASESAPRLRLGSEDASESASEDGEEEVSLRHVELPFGPFLVMAAIAYLFLESWLQVSFGLLWGRGGGPM